MEKRQYTSPLTEATPFIALKSIMITSIGMGGSNLPGEPGAAPKRRTEVF